MRPSNRTTAEARKVGTNSGCVAPLIFMSSSLLKERLSLSQDSGHQHTDAAICGAILNYKKLNVKFGMGHLELKKIKTHLVCFRRSPASDHLYSTWSRICKCKHAGRQQRRGCFEVVFHGALKNSWTRHQTSGGCNLNNPLLLILTYCLDSSFSSSCWYA